MPRSKNQTRNIRIMRIINIIAIAMFVLGIAYKLAQHYFFK
jgi:hypothetical protein